jgi:polyhydroxybutyrate depolymerase
MVAPTLAPIRALRRFAANIAVAVLTLSALDVHARERDMEQISLESGGIARSYLLSAPARRLRAKRPLVILMHGNGGSAAQLMGEDRRGRQPRAAFRRWLEIGARMGWLVVAADGTLSAGPDGRRGWNDCRGDTATNPTIDDVAFIEQLVADVDRRHGVDTARVFAAGHSNGGNMALRLAIERPTMFRAVAAVAAAMPAKSECAAPTQFVPVLFVNGTADPVMPYGGGAVGFGAKDRGMVLATPDSVERWVVLGRLNPRANESVLPDLDKKDGSRVTRLTYSSQQYAAGVVLYRVDGGNHGIPSRGTKSAALPGLGKTNGDLESADAIAAFFAAAMPER